MEDICRKMRNVEVEMKVWSPTGAHLSALKGALLVAQMMILIVTMTVTMKMTMKMRKTMTMTMTMLCLTYQI